MKKRCFFVLNVFFFFSFFSNAQQNKVEEIRAEKIKTIQLFKNNDQTSIPAIELGSGDFLNLQFDDFSTKVKNYYYTLELRNMDWTPTPVNDNYYLAGNTLALIDKYHFSTISTDNYIHYETQFPNENIQPIKSGNYLLKVFKGTDTANLIFSKKCYIYTQKAIAKININQPNIGSLLYTHQKLDITINAQKIDQIIPNNLKIMVVQNNRFYDAVINPPYQYYSNNIFQYDGDKYLVFPGTNPYYFLDIQSFRFKNSLTSDIIVKNNQYYIYAYPNSFDFNITISQIADLNGQGFISTTDFNNYNTDALYGYVTLQASPAKIPNLKNKDVYIEGGILINENIDKKKLEYDSNADLYKTTVYLKQGVYNYNYFTINKLNNQINHEINFFETENDYYVFVYYTNFADQHESLIGFYKFNSLNP